MRARGLLPGVAAVGAIALPGCGSGDDVPVATGPETAPAVAARTTVVADPPSQPTTTSGDGPRDPSEPNATTTLGRAPGTTTRTDAGGPDDREDRPPPAGEADQPPTDDGRTTTRGRDVIEPDDPIGGTTAVRGTDRGTGYTVRVPEGWNDGSKRFEGSSIAFDRTYVKGRGSDVTTNILVVRTRPEGAARRGITGLAPEIRRELSGLAGGVPAEPGPRRTVGGEEAVTFVLRRRLGDTSIVQRQVSVVHHGALFTIGLTATSASYEQDAQVFARFLDSWRWR